MKIIVSSNDSNLEYEVDPKGIIDFTIFINEVFKINNIDFNVEVIERNKK